MRFAGIDIGSRSIKLMVMDNGAVVDKRVADTGFDPLTATKEVLQDVVYDRILATGPRSRKLKPMPKAPAIFFPMAPPSWISADKTARPLP
jgi:hypothetical protein